MKKVMIVLVLAICSIGAFAQTQQGHAAVGLNIGYAFDSENATIGVDYRYSVTDEFRLAPSLTHLIKSHGIRAWMADLNAHYLFRLSDMFGFYPLGGLSFSYWKIPYGSSINRFGLNVGLGGEVYATEQVTVGLEAKYNIVKDLDQASIAVRVGYSF